MLAVLYKVLRNLAEVDNTIERVPYVTVRI